VIILNILPTYFKNIDMDYTPSITLTELKNAIKANDESFVREAKIKKLKNYISS